MMERFFDWLAGTWIVELAFALCLIILPLFMLFVMVYLSVRMALEMGWV